MVKTFNVTIRAVITKTERVEAATKEQAIELAHEQFSVLCDGEEDYDEQTLDCEEVAEVAK